MRFVLDTNIFLFALGKERLPECEKLLDILVDTFPAHAIHIPRIIFREVRNNLAPISFMEFLKIVNIAYLDEDIVVPFQLGDKYLSIGLKHADAFIAAYTEHINAHILVSENRHFLARQENLPFKVLNAEKCLKLLS